MGLSLPMICWPHDKKEADLSKTKALLSSVFSFSCEELAHGLTSSTYM